MVIGRKERLAENREEKEESKGKGGERMEEQRKGRGREGRREEEGMR